MAEFVKVTSSGQLYWVNPDWVVMVQQAYPGAIGCSIYLNWPISTVYLPNPLVIYDKTAEDIIRMFALGE